MIIFVAMPFVIGLMNIIIPLQIGARDVAFPVMNSVSFYLTVAGAGLMMISLGVGEFANTGWTGLAPLFEKEFNPGVGVDYWAWAFQLSGMGTLLGGRITSYNVCYTKLLRIMFPPISLVKKCIPR